MPNRSKAYSLLLNLYQKCNKRQIFAFVKDNIISLILLELYGFYFDIDKVPHDGNNSFFRSLDDFCQISYIEEEINIMKKTNKTKYFSLVTFLDINPDHKDSKAHGDDVGFQFAVYNVNLSLKEDLNELNIEDFQINNDQFDESYKEYVEYITIDFPKYLKDTLPHYYLKNIMKILS